MHRTLTAFLLAASILPGFAAPSSACWVAVSPSVDWSFACNQNGCMMYEYVDGTLVSATAVDAWVVESLCGEAP